MRNKKTLKFSVILIGIFVVLSTGGWWWFNKFVANIKVTNSQGGVIVLESLNYLDVKIRYIETGEIVADESFSDSDVLDNDMHLLVSEAKLGNYLVTLTHDWHDKWGTEDEIIYGTVSTTITITESCPACGNWYEDVTFILQPVE